MKDKTEWVELIEQDVNVLAGARTDHIIHFVQVILGKKFKILPIIWCRNNL